MNKYEFMTVKSLINLCKEKQIKTIQINPRMRLYAN